MYKVFSSIIVLGAFLMLGASQPAQAVASGNSDYIVKVKKHHHKHHRHHRRHHGGGWGYGGPGYYYGPGYYPGPGYYYGPPAADVCVGPFCFDVR